MKHRPALWPNDSDDPCNDRCNEMKRICAIATALALTLSPTFADVQNPAKPDRASLIREFEAAQLRYQQAGEQYNAMRRKLRKDPALNEQFFGAGRSMIGVRLGRMSDDRKGVRMAGVTPQSPADAAGLQAGDIALAINGERLDDTDSRLAVQKMMNAIRRVPAGGNLRIDYLRGDERGTTEFRTSTAAQVSELARRARATASQELGPSASRRTRRERNRQMAAILRSRNIGVWAGLTFLNLTPELGTYFGAEKGVLLAHSTEEELPLMEGDVILKIGEQVPADAVQMVELLHQYEPQELVALELWRHGKKYLVELDLYEPPTPPGEENL